MKCSFLSTLAVLAVLQLVCAEDLKTTNGKEYKNVSVSRVEPDGIVIKFSGGIVKLQFTELPPDVQKKYGYDSAAAATPAVQEDQKQAGLTQQRKADEQQRFEQGKKYSREQSDRNTRSPKKNAKIAMNYSRPIPASKRIYRR
jgi:hypothetical protein